MLCACLVFPAQNQAMKWYFGNQAGLDFSTSPPTVLTNGAMTTSEGCASISDANGNLLFYTNGINIYDQTHSVMANGSGLTGNSSTTQSGMIVKQPGSSNIYYVFSLGASGTGTLAYSIVDMSLAMGNGSVTTKNVVISTNMTEKLTSVKHCNGTDVWVLAHANNSQDFHSYLVTSTGITSTVITGIGTTHTTSPYNWLGNMKASPNGKKLGLAISGTNGSFELYDFNNSTGVVSNSLSLGGYSSAYGCEFSPDGTKFYGDKESTPYCLYQWDLCAGSPTAIVASLYTQTVSSQIMGMQAAIDGKIYIARLSQSTLAVISNPNASGSNCNYVHNGQSVSPKTSAFNLPNFMTSFFVQPPTVQPFTHTVSNSFGCQTASFTSIYSSTTFTSGCSATTFSLQGVLWNFGDPASGALNTSTLQSPSHAFTTLGTYTVQQILYFNCGSDTIRQVVNVNQPCISVSSTSITCASLGSATVQATNGVGPYSYTWMPGNQTNSVATGLSPGSYTITVQDFGNNFTYTALTVFTSLIPLTGNINISNSVSCFGATTGTANVTNIAGGSGLENYSWTNGSITYTTAAPNNLSAGVWTANVTDALTGCTINQVYLITQPPALNLMVSSSTPSTCASRSITLSASSSGGTPRLIGLPYSYTWAAGPNSTTHVVSHSLAGTYIYTVSSNDSLNCFISNTIAVDFVPNPTVTVSNTSICPQEVATIFASGATTYTWNTGATGASLNGSPPINTNYTVVGSALSCTNSAVGSVFLKPLPSPFTVGNTTRCQGEALVLSAYGGNSYVWSGPAVFSSSAQSLSIHPVSLANAGVYQATVTAANSCTAPVSTTVTIHPTPTLSAAGSTVCSNQALVLSSSSLPGSNFLWKGPQNFTANIQNPSIVAPSVLYTGTYTVLVTAPTTCTNMATAQASVTALPNPSISTNGTVCLNGTLNFIASGVGGGTVTWTGPSGFSSTNASTLISSAQLSASGFYSLTVVLGPCLASSSKFALVHPLPSFTMSSDNPCETKDLHLSAGGIANATLFIWQGPVSFTSTLQNPIIPTVNQNHAGIYYLTVHDANGCQSSDSRTVSIRSNPTLTPVSTTVCLNEPAVLSVSGAQSYVWTGPGSYVSYQPNAQIPAANNVSTLTYTVIGTAANQCTAISSADLSTFELPVPSIAILPTNRFCVNSTVQLTGQGGLVYNWSGPKGLLFTGKTVTFVAQSEYYQGSYSLTVTDQNNCKGSTNALLQLDPLPQGSLLGSKMNACAPFKCDFTFVPIGSDVIKSTWQLAGQQLAASSFSFYFISPGQYPIYGMLRDTLTQCVNSTTAMVNVYALPVADFTYHPEKPIENFEEALLTNTSLGDQQSSWHWVVLEKDGSVDYKGETASHLFKSAGDYMVALEVVNEHGCKDTVVKRIEIDIDFTIYVPDAFTPNGDNLNEVFLPQVRGTKRYEMQIYNRWGQLIFSATDPARGWDATYNGEPCQQDSYIWKIKLSTLRGEEKQYSGNVVLIR